MMLAKNQVNAATDNITQIFEQLYDPALLIDPDKGIILAANHAACEFLGYDSREFSHLTPADLHPHEIARLDAFLHAVKLKGRWLSNDLSCRAKNGGLHPAQVRATLVQIEDKTCILALVRDRRDEKLVELGRSLRKLTHDLRNTMVASRLMGDRLRRHDDPLVQRSAEIIIRSVDRAVRMCQTALELGRSEENRPQREHFALRDVIQEVCASVGSESLTGAAVEVNDPQSVQLDADFDQIFRVLLNLVRNSMLAGCTRIILTANAGKHATNIDVGDNGPGLPTAVQKRLFAEQSPTRQTGGSGLGLAIAWELVRNHEGELTLLRTGSEGTVFRISLPNSNASSEEIARRDPAETPRNTPQAFRSDIN